MKQDYFKGFKLFKVVQLIILIVFSVTFFIFIYLDKELRASVYTNKNLLTICVFLWAFMIYNVVCIILDFYQLEGHIAHDNVLNKAVYTDSLTGIPNRFGVDQLFEEYNSGKDISNVGCVLVTISNLCDVNHEKGRLAGNIILINFSRIIERVGGHYGFIGRNNGNEFLTVIDNCDEAKIEGFVKALKDEVLEFNKIDNGETIDIEAVTLLNSDVNTQNFTDLIVRLYEKARER